MSKFQKRFFYILHFTFYIQLVLAVLAQEVLAQNNKKEPLDVLGKVSRVAGPEGAGFQDTGIALGNVLLPTYLGAIVRIALSLLGVIFFALPIYGGFLWLYAGGNEEQVKKAKAIITRAVIGLAITLFAGGITQFVIYYFAR